MVDGQGACETDSPSNFLTVPFGSQDLLGPTDDRTLVDILASNQVFDLNIEAIDDNTMEPTNEMNNVQELSGSPYAAVETYHLPIPRPGTHETDYVLYDQQGSISPQELVLPGAVVPYAPRAGPGPPPQERYLGPYNFTAHIPKSKKCEFSGPLNKLYIPPHTEFAVKFSWEEAGLAPRLVRACVVFQDREHAEQRVECCLSHRLPTVPENVRHNVLLSARALGTHGVYYEGHPSTPDTWYSTLVQFDPAPGSPRTHAYKFVCTNNCSAEGITRRNIGIAFTLEDTDGGVLGRHVIGAKACACPARDRGKDETAAGLPPPGTPKPARKRPAGGARKGKKVKLEAPEPVEEDELLTLPQDVQVVGPRAVLAALEAALRVVEAGAAGARDVTRRDRSRVSIASLRQKIEQYKQLVEPVDL